MKQIWTPGFHLFESCEPKSLLSPSRLVLTCLEFFGRFHAPLCQRLLMPACNWAQCMRALISDDTITAEQQVSLRDAFEVLDVRVQRVLEVGFSLKSHLVSMCHR